jgi:hypothetical protein
MCRCGCIAGVDVHIILPFLHLSCPRLKLILFSQIWLQICSIKCGTNPKICWQIKLLCILINLFEDFERIISSRHQFGLSQIRKPFFSQMQPNQITRFKIQLLSSFITTNFILSIHALYIFFSGFHASSTSTQHVV